jgi:hypothetical protein
MPASRRQAQRRGREESSTIQSPGRAVNWIQVVTEPVPLRMAYAVPGQRRGPAAASPGQTAEKTKATRRPQRLVTVFPAKHRSPC